MSKPQFLGQAPLMKIIQRNHSKTKDKSIYVYIYGYVQTDLDRDDSLPYDAAISSQNWPLQRTMTIVLQSKYSRIETFMENRRRLTIQ